MLAENLLHAQESPKHLGKQTGQRTLSSWNSQPAWGRVTETKAAVKQIKQLSVVWHACQPGAQKTPAGQSGVQGHPWLCGEFLVSLYYASPCLRKQKKSLFLLTFEEGLENAKCSSDGTLWLLHE